MRRSTRRNIFVNSAAIRAGVPACILQADLARTPAASHRGTIYAAWTNFTVCTVALNSREVRSSKTPANYDILGYMTKLLEEAMAKVSKLPEATQESIAEDLIAHVTSVEHLRAELQKGIDSLDLGEGQELDIEQVIRTARAAYDRE